DNKGKTRIYQWTHIESNKTYIGSAVDLSKRFKNYFNKNYLNRFKKMYICNALLHHGYSAFSLSIVENIDISNLSKEEARQLILSREQHYLNSILPGYNILPTAGSLLGFYHSSETKAKMSEAKKGITRSEE